MKRALALMAAVSLGILAIGCGREEAEPEFPNSLMTRVPAGTPYLVATGEPLPEAFSERWEQTIRPVVDEMRASISADMDELAAKHPELSRRMGAAIDEMLSIADEGGLEAAGRSHQDDMVLYGNGLMPVLRVSLTDPAAFMAYISRVLAAAEISPPTAQYEGVEYWRGEMGPVVLAAGLDGELFSLGIDFADSQDRLLAHLFGDERPGRTVIDEGTMPALVAEYGFLEHGIGFIDATRLASLLIGESPENPGLLDGLGAVPVELSPACRTELQGLVAKAPRLVFGYDAIGADHMTVRSVFELEPAIAREMIGWSAPVPGLGVAGDAKVQFGYGLDMVKAGTSIQNWFRQAAEREFACAMLNAVEWKKSAGQVNMAPLYMAGNPKGFVMRLDGFEMGKPAAGEESAEPDIRLEGSVVMLFDNAQGLAAMVKGFVPELQTLDIPVDGVPVPIPDEAKKQFDQPAFAALTEKVLGISVGENGDARLRTAMNAPTADRPPVLHIALDAGWVYGKLAELMPELAELGEKAEPEAAEELRRSGDLMRIYGEIFDRLDYRISFTEKGVTFRQELTLQ